MKAELVDRTPSFYQKDLTKFMQRLQTDPSEKESREFWQGNPQHNRNVETSKDFEQDRCLPLKRHQLVAKANRKPLQEKATFLITEQSKGHRASRQNRNLDFNWYGNVVDVSKTLFNTSADLALSARTAPERQQIAGAVRDLTSKKQLHFFHRTEALAVHRQ